MKVSSKGEFYDELKTLYIDIPNKVFVINGEAFGDGCSCIEITVEPSRTTVRLEKNILYYGEHTYKR